MSQNQSMQMGGDCVGVKEVRRLMVFNKQKEGMARRGGIIASTTVFPKELTDVLVLQVGRRRQ